VPESNKLLELLGIDSYDLVKYYHSALAQGRKAKEAEEAYQLREAPVPQGNHFGVKNEDIGLENTYFGNTNPEESMGSLGRPRRNRRLRPQITN